METLKFKDTPVKNTMVLTLSSGMAVLVSIEQIDKTTAAQYLEKVYSGQRHVRVSWVSTLTGEMKRDSFNFTGEPIIFDEHGFLIDGQHRLKAVIESDSIIEVLVVRGVPNGGYQNIDRGISRTVADNNDQAYAIDQATWLNYGRRVFGKTNTRLTNSMLDTFQDECAEGICWGIDMIKAGNRSDYSPRLVMAMFVFAHKASPTKIDAFYKSVVGNDPATQGTPEYALRYYLQGRCKDDEVREQGLKILRCIKAHIDGESVQASRLYATESMAEHFGQYYPTDSAVRMR